MGDWLENDCCDDADTEIPPPPLPLEAKSVYELCVFFGCYIHIAVINEGGRIHADTSHIAFFADDQKEREREKDMDNLTT